MLNLGESYLLKAVKKDHVESLIFYGLQLSKGDKLPKDDKKSQKYFQKAAKKGSSEAHVRIGQYLVDSAMSDNTKGNKNNILKKAAKEFQIAVKQNNSEAMMELADLYLNGKGVEKSDNEAVNLYKSASENGYPEGINAYAECLRNGKGCEKNVAESARLYKVNADKGDAKALFIYAQMCENGEGVNKDEKEASKYYRNAATAGNVDAVFRVSQLLLEGNDEFEQNQNETLEMLEKAAEMGHPKAMYEYSMRLYHGNGIPKNIEKAIDLCKKSAIKGDLNAEFFYGVILQESEEYDQSFSYLHSAANKGHVDAKIRIAYMRLYGCGSKIDFKEAFELFQANENDQRAIFGQAIMYEQGYFVEQNYSTAISKYREAASKGFVDGIAAESNLLRNGFGFESKDAKAADEMLQNSIENGSILGKLYYAINILNIFIHNSGKKKKSENEVPIREAIQIFTDISEKNKDKLAREKLAFCNLHGIGVPVNVERAIYLYKMSAKQGNRDALYELGMMLHQGKNIPQNKEEGIFNLKKSAKLNNLDAHAYYGWYLLKGDGCNKNVKKACKHTEIAAYHENVPGMAFFGIILYNGLGVQRDVNSAVPYIVKASEAGRADAMDVHGQMLEKGEGLQPNIVQAFHLYQKSAELHNVDGSFHYAQCLEHGRGCQVDFQKAIQLYKFAADSGHVESMYLYALFHDDIDRSKGEIAQNFGESAKYRVSGNVMSLSIIKSFLISHFLLISISKYVVSIGINNFFQSILPFCKN
ncbi:hypothetical protein TRFO_42533 [Tritrichomonas foetus]|uniref:Uncharacterized protein n=1 Tax=Tritrichomonas foetus TaxID=1144522 RepID=A0A1J4KW00_9EUKA|nr:hypothetical protein TRFO_42533 [Tritrichomonas foetus]|eukprot:OHT15411.1 hypothetical protein TRFO_42533 [Tritrichomonas foetus]